MTVKVSELGMASPWRGWLAVLIYHLWPDKFKTLDLEWDLDEEIQYTDLT